MEGIQYIQHRVIDGTYQATMHWRISNSIVSYRGKDGEWHETDIPVNFIKDFEANPTEGADGNERIPYRQRDRQDTSAQCH